MLVQLLLNLAPNQSHIFFDYAYISGFIIHQILLHLEGYIFLIPGEQYTACGTLNNQICAPGAPDKQILYLHNA